MKTKIKAKATKKTVARVGAPRVRREFGRAPRTYYAMSVNGEMLYRFGDHSERHAAMQANGLQPLGALEFREKLLQDTDGKIKVIDTRKFKDEESIPGLTNVRRVPQGSGVSPITLEQLTDTITAAITNGLAPVISGLQNVIHTEAQGEGQPKAHRQVSQH